MKPLAGNPNDPANKTVQNLVIAKSWLRDDVTISRDEVARIHAAVARLVKQIDKVTV